MGYVIIRLMLERWTVRRWTWLHSPKFVYNAGFGIGSVNHIGTITRESVSQCYVLFTQTRCFLTSYCSQRPFGLKKQWHNPNMKSQVQKHH